MQRQLENLTESEHKALGPLLRVLHKCEDLLHPDYTANRVLMVQGHCYTFSEALVHALGGKASGYRPARLRLGPNNVHWWVVAPDGRIIDATAGQYRNPVPYAEGRRTWFLTPGPSKRARVLLERAGLTL